METHDEFEERIRREQQIAARLRLATERLDEARWQWSSNPGPPEAPMVK